MILQKATMGVKIGIASHLEIWLAQEEVDPGDSLGVIILLSRAWV